MEYNLDVICGLVLESCVYLNFELEMYNEERFEIEYDFKKERMGLFV